MNPKSILSKAFGLLLAAVLALTPGSSSASNSAAPMAPVGTTFVYQGLLTKDNLPVNDTCDFTFSLWDAQSGGSQAGSTLTRYGVGVDGGHFTVDLDFGSVWNGTLYWLGIGVQCTRDVSPTSLPRQALRPAPYAMYASNADMVDGFHASAFATAGHSHSHSSLSGLGNDDHPQYFNLNQNENVNGRPYFNGGTGSMPPFYVSSSYLVTDLNADLLDGQHGSYYQARVSATCSVGAAIRAINADGSVVCEAHDDRPGHAALNLDATAGSGTFNAVAIGVDGMPVMAYSRANALWVAHCNDHACTTSSKVQVSPAGDTVQYLALAIGADGMPVMSYYDASFGVGDLKVAHCNDLACQLAANVTTVDGNLPPNPDVGQYNSITIGVDGFPLISYYDATNGHLKVAHCNDIPCQIAPLVTPLDTSLFANVGWYSSITIGSDGLGLVSYYDAMSTHLKAAHCANVLCASADSIVVLDPTASVGTFTSITIASDGLGLISYYDFGNNFLKVAHCNNSLCSTAAYNAVDNWGTTGGPSAISIGSDGMGVISYLNMAPLRLMVGHCDNVVCSSITRVQVDTPDMGNPSSSIAIGTDGMPVISYHDNTNNLLRFTHCSNVFCVPYWRRR
ncbi:MAG: hypothetical protein AB1894_19555 [Chloroflexota bacterium]